MRNLYLLAGVSAITLLSSFPALAQDGNNIVMRRPLNVSTGGADWKTTEFEIFDGSGNRITPSEACGNYELRRDVSCERNGQVVNDSFCRDAGAKPTAREPAFLDEGCTYTWSEGGWVDPGPNCTNSEAQTQAVVCLRDLDSAPVDDALCTETKPPVARTVPDYSTCTYTWNESGFQDPGPACTPTETWTQDVSCRRDLDNVTVSDGLCTASARPSETSIRQDYSNCTYSWDTGEFVDPGQACTSSETQTRAVFCKRDLDDNVEADSRCNPSARPSATQTVADYSSCSYEWVQGAWQDPGASCTANEAQTRTVTCRRSDGTTVPDGECSGTKPATSQNVEDFSGCSYAWQSGGWSAWSNTCTTGGASRTRSVSCRRSDGTTVADSNCGGARPTSSETGQSVYSGCSYSYALGNWQDPGASCTANETQTRTVQCRRSNGENVSNSFCSGGVPASSQSVADYSGCSYAWQTGNWSGWNSTCSPTATRTRTVQCRRSDGTTVSNSTCGGGAPSSSETAAIYSGCSPTQSWGSWSNWSSTCSNSATRSRTATCVSGGVTLPASECTSRGIQLSQTESSAIYSGCSYSAGYGSWSTCSNSSQTRSMNSCRNTSLNNNVALSECTNRGIPATQSQSCSSQTYGGFCSFAGDGSGPGTFLGGANGTKNQAGTLDSVGPGNSMSRGSNVAPYPLSNLNGSGIYSNSGTMSGSTPSQVVQNIRNSCRALGGTCFEQSEAMFSEFGTPINTTINWRCFGGGSSPVHTTFSYSESNGGADYNVLSDAIVP